MSEPALCFVTISTPGAAPPVRGTRCAVTPDVLLAEVCDATGVDPLDIRGHARDPFTVSARWAWWALLRESGRSYPEIGRLVGRDHSSIIHALKHAPDREQTLAVLAAVRGNNPPAAR
jgi:chromosomal replication initiation ATPase DnaA